VARRNEIAIRIQIAILIGLIIVSSFLTILIPIFGFYTEVYYVLMPLGVPSSVISTILMSWYSLPVLGVGPGFIVITIYYGIEIYFWLYRVGWINYIAIVMGPLTLVLAIICLSIVIKYWKSPE